MDPSGIRIEHLPSPPGMGAANGNSREIIIRTLKARENASELEKNQARSENSV
jgi:hypothetical protein